MASTTEMQSFYTPSTSSHLSSHAPAAMDELISKYSSMSNSTSPTTPATTNKATSQGWFRRMRHRVWMEYYRYQVTFGLYVMTPSEKFAANTFVMVVLSLLFWALLLYFPSLLYSKLSRLVWLLTGHSGEEVGAVLGIIDSQSNHSIPPPLSTASLMS